MAKAVVFIVFIVHKPALLVFRCLNHPHAVGIPDIRLVALFICTLNYSEFEIFLGEPFLKIELTEDSLVDRFGLISSDNGGIGPE